MFVSYSIAPVSASVYNELLALACYVWKLIHDKTNSSFNQADNQDKRSCMDLCLSSWGLRETLCKIYSYFSQANWSY